MRRRRLLGTAIVAALALATGGGALMALRPAIEQGRLAPASRTLMRVVADALLEGIAPVDAQERRAAMQALLDRIDAVIAALPDATQSELSQLLAILATAPGRRALLGLREPWGEAPAQDVAAALQAARESRWTVRRQVYQALHEIVDGAWFADPSAWPFLGYPGPREV